MVVAVRAMIVFFMLFLLALKLQGNCFAGAASWNGTNCAGARIAWLVRAANKKFRL